MLIPSRGPHPFVRLDCCRSTVPFRPTRGQVGTPNAAHCSRGRHGADTHPPRPARACAPRSPTSRRRWRSRPSSGRAGVAAEEVVPGARTVVLEGVADPDGRRGGPRRLAHRARAAVGPGALVEVPVTYDGADLDDVAARWGTDVRGVAARLAGTDLVSAFCGFAPGFAYLSGLAAELAVPRLDAPRPRVPAGSVAVADRWCGIYPTASPGGWRLVGRTDLHAVGPGPRTRPRCSRRAPGSGWCRHDDSRGRAGRGADHGPGSRPHGARPPRRPAGRGARRTGRPSWPTGWSATPPDAALLEVTLGGFVARTDRGVWVAVDGCGPTARPGGVAGGRRDARGPGAGHRRPVLRRGRRGDRRARRCSARGRRTPSPGWARRASPTARCCRSGRRRGRPRGARHAAAAATGAAARAPGTARGVLRRRCDPGAVRRDVRRPARVEPRRPASRRRAGRRRRGTDELPSEGMVLGAVQVPPDGQPVVLLADHPPTGGYPVVGVVDPDDLWQCAQLRPGESVSLRAA